MQPRPRTIFFDVGDTLVRPQPSWPAVYASVFPQFGIDVDPEAFRAAWREAFVDWQFEGPFEASEEASYQRFKELDGRIFARLGYPDLPEEFFRAVEHAFSARAAWFVFDDVMPALHALRAAGFRLAVISNWGWSAPELLHELELAAHFEVLVISARVGYQKPHPSIFRHALELLEEKAEQALHVGDSYQADVLGARRAGLTPVLIAREAEDASRLAEDLGEPALLVIRDFLELLDALGVSRPTPARSA